MEEFSFPTVVTDDRDPFYHLHRPTSSSLWYFHSPEADAGHLCRSFSEGGANIAVTRSRAVRRPSSPAALSDCGEESGAALEFDERMDLLWEDFNEELFRGSLDGEDGRPAPALLPPEKSSRRRSSSSSLGIEGLAVVAAERSGLAALAARKERQRHGSTAAALEMRPPGRTSVRRRKPGLAVMLRMLKKLFVVQTDHSNVSKKSNMNL